MMATTKLAKAMLRSYGAWQIFDYALINNYEYTNVSVDCEGRLHFMPSVPL